MNHNSLEKQTESCRKILDDFAKDFKVEEIQNLISDMLEASLTSDHEAFGKPQQRADAIYAAKRLDYMLHAFWVQYKYK